MEKSRAPINIPNMLTILRILITPLFVICLMKGMSFSALLLFTIAGISDGLDGLLARYFNQTSVLGAYLDPIADKLLLTSSYATLAIIKIIPGWVAVLVISRDILIFLGIAIITIVKANIEIRPRMISKCTTVVQLLTIFVILLNFKIADHYYIINILYYITVAFTIVSGLHYIYIGLNILQEVSVNNGTKS